MRSLVFGLAALALPAQLPSLPPSPLAAAEKSLHLLNRLAYGPRVGEAERLTQGGDAALAAWILAQLSPGRDPALEARLAAYPTLGMDIPALQKAFPLPTSAEARQELPPEQRPARIELELGAGKLLRAVYAERQVEEVLTDFWFNHFNVDWGKGECKWFVPAYERQAIRPHVFGRFRDLLAATAGHPAMLFYLDNWLSTREGFDPSRYVRLDDPKGRERLALEEAARLRDQERRLANRPPTMEQMLREARRPQPRKMGLNENYARELLELHTMGVDGGYTQQDVREVARCFTGWTLDQPRQAAVARFRPVAHDPGDKVVLGTRIGLGGVKDGEAVLDLLARHPATARFIATKLCRRFVADEPPPALVERVAEVFLKTGGELRQVYASIFFSPEFWSAGAYLAKVKSPLEFLASALRSLGAEVEDPAPLLRHLARMGQPLYRCAPPIGWKDTAEAWVSTGTLVNRLQLGLALGRPQVKAVTWTRQDLAAVPGAPPEAALDHVARLLLQRPLGPGSRAVLLKDLDGAGKPADGPAPGEPAKLVGLLLGSPEFQRR